MDDRLSQADLDRIIADPLRATPVDAERMAKELGELRERMRRKRKVTDAQVNEIRARRAHGESLRAIAADYDVSHAHVRDVCNVKTYGYVDSGAGKSDN